MTAAVLQGNARTLPLADNTVDLIVTSPPYFALRSYQDGGEHYPGQIGSEPTPAEFLDALLEVTRECVRVLKPSGSLFVNLGDKYAERPGPERPAADQDDLRYRKAIRPRRRTGGMQPKSLMGIPWRYAIRCIDDLGLILRAEIIWSKPNGLPESVTDRVRRSHEQWFHFVLQPWYFSAIDEIREEHLFPDQSRTKGKSMNGGMHSESDAEALNPLGRLPGSVWTIPTEPLTVPEHLGVDHFAAFPTEWPRRLIQGWSPIGVCTACGEGRRPAVAAEYAVTTADIGVDSKRLNPAQGNNFAADRALRTSTITGYVCADTPWHWAPSPTRYDPYAQVIVYDWDKWDPPPTIPAVILDPFGGTGTVALVANALGRHGISIDMSGDYSRLAQWRTTDPRQLARAARKPWTPPREQVTGQLDLLEGLA